MSGIISPFQLKRNRVVSFSIEQKEVAGEYETTTVNLGADYNISKLKEQGSRIEAQLDLFIVLNGNADREDSLFNIKLDMMGIFEAEKKQIDKDRFLDMLKINGISTLMQLSRAYITSVTALSGFAHPVNFPMVNIYELIHTKENREQKGEQK